MMKIELFKIIRKREFVVLMCMLCLPIVFGLLLFAGAIKSTDVSAGALSLPGLMAVTVGFFEQLGILGIIVGIVAVSTLSMEIDNHNVLLYFPRLSSRKRLYVNKVLALSISFTIWFFLFLLICCFSYLFLFFFGSPEVSGLITDAYTPGWISSLFGTYVYLLFIINFALFIGSYLKPLVSILCLLGILFGSILLHPVPVIGHLLPVHYMQVAMNHLSTKAGVPSVITNYAIAIAMSFIYTLVFTLLGRKRMASIEV